MQRPSSLSNEKRYGSPDVTVSCIATAITLWLWPEARSAANHSLTAIKLMQGLWPVAGGFLLFLCWQRIAVNKKVAPDTPNQPSALDDILRGITEALQEKEWQQPKQDRVTPYLQEEIPRLRKAEKIMGRWKVIGLSYLVLCFCLLYLLL